MSGWNAASQGWARTRRSRPQVLPDAGQWTKADVLVLVVAFVVRWELGLAFLGLKLWHQASGRRVSTLAFAQEQWNRLVATVQDVTRHGRFPIGLHVGARSSGSPAFDHWRRDELARIEAERAKLAAAEDEFARYRNELLKVKDREEFDRFMSARPPVQ